MGNRSDVESYSVMAEIGELEEQHLFLLSLNFDLNQSISGEQLDYRGSIECEFELDSTIPGEFEAVEFDNMLPLDDIFTSIADWEPFRLVKGRSLPFTWEGPQEVD